MAEVNNGQIIVCSAFLSSAPNSGATNTYQALQRLRRVLSSAPNSGATNTRPRGSR